MASASPWFVHGPSRLSNATPNCDDTKRSNG
eukprot:CAMPEP_0179604714 /NCGR_PEP_ID=MMETSP0930-20121108/549_1 /TAXON_ID=548131 ORGANISM="Ostreococcus mediterraneus, Strain clade-D-RCC1621" /NCGR_SAMPLE_ID=MMETSP0930 /ASSEMBLY_ACC=CAM_ASM_000580 /LENGTH=30 /DNA_ID= /DNA_START= /DNA_END= /DNA_ORIENTATION=